GGSARQRLPPSASPPEVSHCPLEIGMDGHFRAFSFVDRITGLEPGRAIRGRYSIPAGLANFPMALVGEAVGQLAAWAAMAALEFKCRPVAGLAAEVNFFAPVRPGQILELT